MPWTAYTMLVGCLAIIGGGIPFLIGLSGYYSKDSIIAQALSFKNHNPHASAACSSTRRRRRGDHGVLHVPPVVHDVRRQAARSSRLRSCPRIAAGDVRCRWSCWRSSPSCVGWPVFGVSGLCWSRPGRRDGDHGDQRGLSAVRSFIPSEHLSHEGRVHVLGHDRSPASRRWPGFCWPRSIYAWRLLESRRDSPTVPADLSACCGTSGISTRLYDVDLRSAGDVRLAARGRFRPQRDRSDSSTAARWRCGAFPCSTI